MTSLNVVMLARDRKRLTQQSIYSMLKNRTSGIGLLTLTVVDDASKALIAEWFLSYRISDDIQVIRNEVSAGTGAARNQGIAAARERFGDDNLLYLTDNDVWFAPGWDKVLLAAHEQFKGFKLIGGGCHPFLQAQDFPYLGIVKAPGYRMTSRDALSGYSWLLDWQTWDEFGPLDAHALGVRQSEDFAMCQKVRKAGYFVGSVHPEVVIHTGITDTFGEHPPGWELIDQNRVEGVLYL